MKQILFLIILVLVGYFVLWGGTTRVLYKADISPKSLLTNLASGVDEDFLPEVDPSRNGFKYTNSASFGKIKENIFITYDPDVCFAFIDLVYSSGSRDSEALIRQYLTMFTLPEDAAKVLNLLKSYKDKQTMGILLSLYKTSDISKSSILNTLSDYHTPEVAQTIKSATLSEDLVLAQTAQNLADSLGEQRWYKEGIKNMPSTGSGNLPVGGQYKGTDFDGEMSQY